MSRQDFIFRLLDGWVSVVMERKGSGRRTAAFDLLEGEAGDWSWGWGGGLGRRVGEGLAREGEAEDAAGDGREDLWGAGAGRGLVVYD